jgi:glycosyltransferase involved in cell wall biosynthesis
VTSEAFDFRLTNLGGFGKAGSNLAHLFSSRPELGVDASWIMPRHEAPDSGSGSAPLLQGCPVVWRRRSLPAFRAALRAARFDLLASIDFQSLYRLPIWLLPRVPVLYWLRDPWSPECKAKLATLRMPGDPEPTPQGLFSRDLRSFRFDALAARVTGRRFAYAAPAELVFKRIPSTYGIHPRTTHLLPNFALRNGVSVPKALRPTVLFVGRFDPVKRPWLVHEIARRMPDVRFEMAGATNMNGPGAWNPDPAPSNVVHLGLIEGETKARAFSRSWILLNTSIHEGLPITFQESLAYGVPIVGALDPDQVVSRFGKFVGEVSGDGLAAVPRFVAALRDLLDSEKTRTSLGTRGREWVESVHNERNFLRAFGEICAELGLGWRPTT